MIVLVFALPQESRDIVKRLGNRDDLLILHTGVGETAAYQALSRYDSTRWKLLISAGFSGGLDPTLPVGALVLAGDGPIPQILNAHIGELTTTAAPVETPQAKAELYRVTGALAVDMETAAIHAFCRKRNIPWFSLRVISDTATQSLPVPYNIWFDAQTQRSRPLALCWFLMRNPGKIFPFTHFIRDIYKARRVLTAALLKLVEALPKHLNFTLCSVQTPRAPGSQLR